MPNFSPTVYDVIIAGAGPVGLFLACELRLAGCSVLMIEKEADPSSPLKDLPFGLRGLSVATIENFDRRGLLDELKSRAATKHKSATAHWMQQRRRPGGHFAGIQFFEDQIDDAQWPYRLPGLVGSLAADMASIEAVLVNRALALGVEIRRGCGVDAIDASTTGVIVRAGNETFEGSWLVGCDGGRSTVRKAAGIGFTGTEPEFTGYSVQLALADPAMLEPGRHYTPEGMYTFAAPDTIAMVDFDGGAFHRTEITRDHIEMILRKVSGVEVVVTALHLATTWTDRAFQATDYRRGRVLLAGDAAHIHSPLGGQGLNLGLGDAMNLGWKLGATINGDASDDLLDTYMEERHPISAQVLDWSRAQVALMRPTPSSRALAEIIRDLIDTRDGATYFAERIWGVGLRYELGGSHPLVGRGVPDFELVGSGKISEHLRAGRGLLLNFGGHADLDAVAAGWEDRFDYISGHVSERLGVAAALVRPDGVVAWACESVPDVEGLENAVKQWFGRPDRDR